MDKIKNMRKQGEIEKPNHWKTKEIRMKEKLLLLFVLITSISVGQNKYQDDIYFNKRIDTKKANIDSLTTVSLKENSENSIDSKNKQSKLIGIIEVGYQKEKQINPTNYRNARIKINAIAGYQINPYYSLGIGTGLRYDLPELSPTVPIFANFKATIPRRNYSPYLSLGLGSIFVTSDFESIGYFFDPRLGISIKTNGKWSINIAVNYELQLSKDYVKYEKVFGPTCILMGISF